MVIFVANFSIFMAKFGISNGNFLQCQIGRDSCGLNLRQKADMSFSRNRANTLEKYMDLQTLLEK